MPNTEMPVVCWKNEQFGTVDHAEASSAITLIKDANGEHHFIAMGWVTAVDDQVHVDRPSDQAMREWSTGAPT